MFTKNCNSFVAACLMGVVGILPAVAELPILTEKEWLGYYLGHKTRTYRFGVTGQGETLIQVIGKNGEPLGRQLALQIDFLVDETMPDGQVVSRKVARESLESDAPATDKLDKVVIKGKARGDTSVEIFMDENRGAIALGGRIVDPGTCKNPLRFSVQLKFQNPYLNVNREGKKELEFQQRIKDDRIQLVSIDGKRSKPSSSEVLNAKDVSGAGLKALAMELDSYQGKKFEITASDNSVMHLSNTTPGPLHEGFTVSWSVDPAKDPQNRARMEILVK